MNYKQQQISKIRMTRDWKPLDIAIIGAGLGGLSAAIALRRDGHRVRIYERYDFANEVGASLSCAANGSRHLVEWGVDVPATKPVILKDLIRHDWKTGEVEGVYPLGDYKEKFGVPYYNFHRIDLHTELKKTAIGNTIPGEPCELHLNHKAIDVDTEAGEVTFENGVKITADMIIAADGIRSQIRQLIGVVPQFDTSTSCCYRCLINRSDVLAGGFPDFSKNEAIEFWGGRGIDKIVMSPCNDGEVLSCYCFYPASYNNLRDDGWNNEATVQQLLDTFPELDPTIRELFKKSYDIKQWRLYVHQQYPYWTKGKVALMSDAAHPMLPDQSQGACMAIEDAAALGYIFSNKFTFTPEEGMNIYEQVRKDRATKVQRASAKARENLDERIGWSSSYDKPGKLTIEEVCGYDLKGHVDQIAFTTA